MSAPVQPETLIDHLFRRQAGRMVSHLTRLLGPAHIDLAEEAAQEAMLRALQSWPHQGVPDNAAAWLFRAAHNFAIDQLRRSKTHLADSTQLLESLASDQSFPTELEDQLRDDELRMIFMCCHPAIPRESSVALSLKTVGGFSVAEIARAFLADDAAIAQRLVRAKRQIRAQNLSLDLPKVEELAARLDSVLAVIYLMFNEGYSAHDGEQLIRHDLCFEALRLGRLVAGSSISTPSVHALVALMALQAARLAARTTDSGDLILLDSQDRTRWDQKLIGLGFHHFERSMAGDDVTPYHSQAAIAATHARALSAEHTDWPVILKLYDQLLALNPTPVVALNRAVAVAKVHGPGQALTLLDPLLDDPKLRDYYLLLAVKGHLLAELGNWGAAAASFRAALDCPCSAPERRFLERKWQECLGR